MKSLTPVEQNILAVAAQAGDRKAVSDLLAHCERDVLAIVAKWRVSEAESEDLAQVARMAILEHAIRTFNPTKGYQFRYWAAQWARTEVKRSKNLNSSMVVVNVNTSSTDFSLDAPPVRNDDSTTWDDLLPGGGESPEEAALEAQDSDRVRKAMECIISSLHRDASQKYDRLGLCRDLVYSRLLSERPLNLDTLALRYGVARETVRKLEVALLKRARGLLVEA